MFSWAVEVDLIDRSPCAGLRMEDGDTEREPMEDDDFRALMRHSPPTLRRLLLFCWATGCRGCEVRKLKWGDIDFGRRIATLRKHKTRKRTRKPRIIYLNDTVLRLLAWMQRADRRVCRVPAPNGKEGISLPYACQMLADMLRAGPVPSAVLRQQWKALRFPLNSLYRAGRELGAIPKASKIGATTWALPAKFSIPEFPTAKTPGAEDLVFLNERGGPWCRHVLARTIQRKRDKLGLRTSCHLHALRHRYATQAFRRGVSLPAISKLLGHANTTVTARVYVHLGEQDIEMLCQAAEVALGKKAPASVEQPAVTNGQAQKQTPPVVEIVQGRAQPGIPPDSMMRALVDAFSDALLRQVGATPARPPIDVPPAPPRPALPHVTNG
jgi:integrase